MRSVIYVLDTYEEIENMVETDFRVQYSWVEDARASLTEYAKAQGIDIVFLNEGNYYLEKFDSLVKNVQEERKDSWKIHKFLRMYTFADSDYDYAYFIDLDTIVLDKNKNLDSLIDTDKIYFNKFGRGRRDDKKINPMRKQRIRRYCKDPSKAIHFSTGFMCCSKKHCEMILSFLESKNLNLLTEAGVETLLLDITGFTDDDRPRGLFTDEVLMNMAINSGILDDSQVCASEAGICDEFWIDNPNSILFHVISNRFDKQRVFFLLNEFLKLK